MIQKSGAFKKIIIAAAVPAVLGILLIISSQVMVRTGKGLGEDATAMTPVGVFLVLAAGAGGGWYYIRFRQQWHEFQSNINKALAQNGVTLLVAPRSAMMPDEKVHDLWRRMSVILKRESDLPGEHVSWEVFGDRDRIAFLMRIPKAMLRQISGELAREFPEVEIIAIPDKSSASIPGGLFVDPPFAAVEVKKAPPKKVEKIVWQNLVLARSSAYPLFSSAKAQGQIMALMGAVSATHPQARTGYQFLVRKALSSTGQQWQTEANKLIPKPKPNQPAPKIPIETRRTIEALQARAQEPIFDLVIRCWASSTNGQLAASELSRVAEALIAETVAAGMTNQLALGQNGQDPQSVLFRSYPPEPGVQITASELGEFLHLPGKKTAEPYTKLAVASAKRLPPSPTLIVREHEDLSQFRILGQYEHQTGDVDVVGQPVIETRKHTYGVGPTGSGKSVAMINGIISDFGNERAGVLMVEPSGDVPADLVAGLPREALNKVVLLSPSDPQPFASNMCDVGSELGLTTAVKNALGAIQMGMGANWATSVRMQQIITNALYVIQDVLNRPGYGGASLLALSKFLQNEAYRDALLVNCSLQAMAAKEFWVQDFFKWGEQQQSDAVSVALRRLSEWISNPEIRRTLSMPVSTIDLKGLLGHSLTDNYDPHIVLLPLTNNDTKSLIGALFVASFTSMIMSRHVVPKADRPPTKLYIDEFADFVNTSGGDSVKVLLAQARKFGAGVTLLTQGQSQIARDVQVELNVNTLTKFYYMMTGDEARLASRQMAGVVSEYDMGRIPEYHAYVKIGNKPPALVRMSPPIQREEALPALKRGYSVKPPKGWKSLVHSTEPFGRFMKSEIEIPDAAKVELLAPDLLAWVNRQVADGDPEQLIQHVANLSDDDFAALEETRREYDFWRAGEITDNPGLVTDPFEYVQWRSRWLYGIPWWLSDARFLRLLNETGGGADQADDELDQLLADSDLSPLVAEDDWTHNWG
ncbi:MAG: hypothetical protein GY803_10295 [Chloroflexi bacterium]|nr:hypothetical protein [Chloroflexota bacterium]